MELASLDRSAVGLSWVVKEPMERASHALVADGRMWLVDPTDDPAAIEQALTLGQPAGVLQLLDRHRRDCEQLARRLGVPHERVPRTLPDTPFEVVPVVGNPLWKEVALWWPAKRTLVVAEALGTAHMFAPGPAGAGVHIALRLRPPHKLADYGPRRLLVGHGPPIEGPTATTAVSEAIARSRRDLPNAVVAMVRAGIGR